MENNENDQIMKKMQEEIKDLQAKYNSISGDVKAMKNSQAELQGNMSTIGGSLEKMSKNVEEMMNKLNLITDEQQQHSIEQMMHKSGGLFFRLVKKPLRKLAVGTVSTAMVFGDYAWEKIANTKEGLEDIVAEASYHKNKRLEQQD